MERRRHSGTASREVVTHPKRELKNSSVRFQPFRFPRQVVSAPSRARSVVGNAGRLVLDVLLGVGGVESDLFVVLWRRERMGSAGARRRLRRRTANLLERSQVLASLGHLALLHTLSDVLRVKGGI